MTLVPKPGVLDIQPYVGGRSHAPGAERVTKLSSNETPFGPSPKAIAAAHGALAEIGTYPEGGANILRQALSGFHGLDAARIVCGNGSDELLALIASCYLRPKDEVVMSAHGFLVYKIATLANSAMPIEIPEDDLKMDVDAVLARVTGRTRLVYVANPNNPTGTYLSADELRRLHDGLPASVLFVVDAAYAEYVGRNDYDSGFQMVEEFDNVVITRTFSKVYGLAGLRVGWAYCPEHVAETLNRVRAPFNVNIAGQRAAVAALEDRDHLAQSVRHNEYWRDWLTKKIRSLGLDVVASVGNFVLIGFSKVPGKSAADADHFLTSRGLILRRLEAYKLFDHLRLTVGTEEANLAVVEALSQFLSEK
nr:MAG: histidinol-phosphate transaminase [Hyphomicrobiales bacterium]